MAIASLLASIANWSTPTILFCVLNLTIATIFITSNYKSPHRSNLHPGQLSRSHDEYGTIEYNSASQLGRSPSLLQRIRSVDLSFSSFHNSFPSESDRDSLSQLTRTPSFMDRVRSLKLIASPFNSDQLSDKDEHSDNDQHHDPPENNNNISDKQRPDMSSQLSRTPSLLDRIKSFKQITSPFNSDQLSRSMSGSKDEDEHSDINPHLNLPEDDDIIDRSKTIGGSSEKWLRSKIEKSEKGKEVAATDNNEDEGEPKVKVVVSGHDASVDAKADDFIKRFKQQLKLQRLDSLQRLREMLNRGI